MTTRSIGISLQILAGGAPTPQQLAALVAACSLHSREGERPTDARPDVYRSPWRRAAIIEMTDVPVGIKDIGPAWGGMA